MPTQETDFFHCFEMECFFGHSTRRKTITKYWC